MRMVPFGPLKRTSLSSGAFPVSRFLSRCAAAPYHVPRALFAELATRRPSAQRFAGPPAWSLAIFNDTPTSMPPSILGMPLVAAAFRVPDCATQTYVEDIEMDVEPATESVLTSGTDTDVEMYDTTQEHDASVIDVEMEDLDTKLDISLNEIASGIADLYLDEVDKLAAQLADLTLKDKRPGESFALDVDVLGMSIDPPTFEELVWAPSLSMVGPSVWHADRVLTPNLADVTMADIDDLDCEAEPNVMMDVDEWSPSDGFTDNFMDTTVWPPTMMHEVYGEARNCLLPMETAAVFGAQTLAMNSSAAELEARLLVSTNALALDAYAEARLPDYEKVVDSTCEPTSVNESLEDDQEDESQSMEAEEDDEEAQFAQEFLLLAADDFLVDVKEDLEERERRLDAENYGAPIPEEDEGEEECDGRPLVDGAVESDLESYVSSTPCSPTP